MFPAARFRWRGLLAVALVCFAVRPVAAQVFNPEVFTLENGMQVVVVPNHRVPVVSHMVWYKVGAADEEPGRTGLAHLLEHLMFKGTEQVPAGEFSRIVARNGGRDNAFTSSDFTAYYQNVAVDRLELVMKLEADRMANLLIDPASVATEREVVLEERRSRTDNDPAALLSERVEAVLYLNHPYRNPIIGWASEVAKLDRDAALAFYRRYYAPNNAVLIVAGDITAEKLRPLAEKYYGNIATRPTPPRVRPQEPPPAAARRVVLEDGQVQQPSWSRRYLAPSYSAGASHHAYPLQILAEVIGGGSTSRLYRSLVVDQKLASAAGAWYEPTSLDLTTFGVYASPRQGVPMEKLESAMLDELRRIAEQGVDAGEVERAKNRLRASIVYARDSLHTGAYTLGQALTTGQSVEDVEAWPQRIAQVTPEQVTAAARLVLDDKASVTGVLLPDGKPEARG